MMTRYPTARPLAGGVCSLASAFGGHRIRFDLEDGSGRGVSGMSDDGGGGEADAPADARDALAAALRGDAAPDADAQQSAETAAQVARDEQGRFVVSTAVEPSAPAVQPVGEQAAIQVVQSSDPAVASSPPAALSPAAKAEWAKVPLAVQQDIARRESEVQRGFESKAREHAQTLGLAVPFAQMYSQTVGRAVQPAEVIAEWGRVAQALQQNPAEAVRFLAQQYKVDLAQLVTGQPTQQQDTYVDPQVAALQQHIQRLEAQVGQVGGTTQQFQQYIDQQRQQAEVQARNAVDGAIRGFAETKDEAGGLKYPHFETVRSMMAALMESGQAASLHDAYDMAAYANPQVRQSILAAQQAKQQQQDQQKAQQAAQAAKAASGSVRGGPGGSSALTPLASASDELRRALSGA